MREMAVSTQAEARLRTAALRLKSALAAAEVMAAGARVLALLGKANFDPDQPRVPRGEPDGGQWTRVEGWHSSRPRVQPASNEPPPEIPAVEPPRASLRWPIVKLVARWVFRIGVEATPVGRVLDIIQAAEWIYDYAPYVQAYLDKPKTLAELQQATSEPKRGYDVHHIVEKTPALDDGYLRALRSTLRRTWCASRHCSIGGSRAGLRNQTPPMDGFRRASICAERAGRSDTESALMQ